jgi:hypothetical protein
MKNRNIAWILLILILGMLLSACGPSAVQTYAENVTAPVNDFSAKFNEFGNIFSGGNMDDVAWQQQVNTAMDDLDKAAAALSNAAQGEVPDQLKAFDGYLKEVASETPNMTAKIREAFKEYNDGNAETAKAKLDEAGAIFKKISTAAGKMNAEGDALSQ